MVSKVENVDPKVPKQAEAKRDGVINPQNYNFNQFYTDNFDALKRYESTEVDRRTWLHVSSGTHWSTSSDTHQVVEIYRDFYLDVYAILNMYKRKPDIISIPTLILKFHFCYRYAETFLRYVIVVSYMYFRLWIIRLGALTRQGGTGNVLDYPFEVQGRCDW